MVEGPSAQWGRLIVLLQCFRLLYVCMIIDGAVGAGVGDCPNDSTMGWIDGSGVPLNCYWSGSDCACTVSSISFIAAVRSILSSEAASASVLDTSLRAFLIKICYCFQL